MASRVVMERNHHAPKLLTRKNRGIKCLRGRLYSRRASIMGEPDGFLRLFLPLFESSQRNNSKIYAAFPGTRQTGRRAPGFTPAFSGGPPAPLPSYPVKNRVPAWGEKKNLRCTHGGSEGIRESPFAPGPIDGNRTARGKMAGDNPPGETRRPVFARTNHIHCPSKDYSRSGAAIPSPSAGRSRVFRIRSFGSAREKSPGTF